MGQVQSTPLSLVLGHFRDIYQVVEDSGVIDVRFSKLMTFCRNEWPTSKVDWSKERTFHMHIIYWVKAIVYEVRVIWSLISPHSSI